MYRRRCISMYNIAALQLFLGPHGGEKESSMEESPGSKCRGAMSERKTCSDLKYIHQRITSLA